MPGTCFPFLVVLLVVSLPAQTGGGSLAGSVAGASGVSLAHVQIAVVNGAGAKVASGETDASGAFRVAGVAPGSYTVLFEAAGFTPTRVESIVVRDGQIADIPAVLLQASQVSTESRGETVQVPVVDTERVQQADTILQRQVRELPINRRDYLNLATITPGVVEVNDYVGITDAPLVQAPQSGLSFGGNNGRGNVFWLDGGENYINTGGVRPSISQEAVAEFHVDRSNYSAEYGGGVGGIVNIVSQSGSNEVHGDVFGFLRHRSVQARNFFDPGKGAFTRSQVGGTIGGPLRKNRTFAFAAFERLQREETSFVPILRDRTIFSRLTPSQQALLDFMARSPNALLQTLAGLTQQGLVTTTFPATIALFDANSGVFPFSESNTLGSARIDHAFNDNHHFFLRFNAGNGDTQNSSVEALTGFNRGLVSEFNDRTLMLNDTKVISASLVSETRFSINRYWYDVGNRDRIGPSIDINGYGYFGKEWTLPGTLHEWHGQFQQNLFYANGRHSIRFGIDINPVHDAVVVQTNLGGRFSFGEYLPIGALYNQFIGDPSAAAFLADQLAQAGGASLTRNLNDPVTALQAFNLGVPAFYAQGFGDPTFHGWFHHYNFFVNDVFHATPNLTINAGVRYELQMGPVLPTDPSNLAPRIGLAWTPTADRKTVVRAGYGLFFLRNNTQTAVAIDSQSGKRYNQVVVPITGLPGSRNPLTGAPISSADIYGTLLAQGVIGKRGITAADLAQFGIVPGPNFPFQVIFLQPAKWRNAYAQQVSLEIERAVGRTSVSVAYNFNRTAHLPRLRDTNLQYGPGGAGQPALVPRDPLIGQLIAVDSAANSFYHALILQAERRLADRLTFNAHYTFSKSIDETTDLNFVPNDSLNPRADRGLSTFDQRHRFVASAIVSLPGRVQAATIVTAASGRPFNLLIGQDPSTRPAGAGRNIGIGPSFVDTALRLSRRFRIGKRESQNLEAIAEGFNLVNHTNFRRLNNVVGQLSLAQLPHPIKGRLGNPTEPLAFVSAYDARQFQFAMKLHF